MKKSSISMLAITFIVFALLAAGFWKMTTKVLGPPDGPEVITCNDTQRSAKPQKVFIMHIPKDIFGDLRTGGGDCAAIETCVSTLQPISAPPQSPGSGSTGPDDDDVDDLGIPGSPDSASAAEGSGTNWPTALDIDLDPDKNGKYWNLSSPILIKIVLDNPLYTFLREKPATKPLTTTTNAGDPTVYAVRKGYEDGDMFGCVSRPRQINHQGRWFITLRVFKTSGAGAQYGGLNIGVLVPITDLDGNPLDKRSSSKNAIGSSPNAKIPLVVPVYVDPQIHNNG